MTERKSFILSICAWHWGEIIMHIHNNNINSKIKDNSKVTYSATTTATTSLLLLATTILAVAGISIALASVPVYFLQSAEATTSEGFSGQDVGIRAQAYAPMAASQDGNNVYIVWWTNKSETGK